MAKSAKLIGVLTCGLLILSPATLRAHDSWLVADPALTEDGGRVRVSFITGEVFPVGEQATQPDRVSSFVDVSLLSHGTIDVVETGATSIFADVAMTGEGLHVIGLALHPRLLELTPEKFEAYLEEEDAREALAAIRMVERPDASVVERYTKYAKTFVAVGTPQSLDGYDLVVGHRLEIIPLVPPTSWMEGGQMPIRVLLDGHPWPDVAISAGHDGLKQHGYAVRTRTNANGEATIPLTQAGHWFVKAHMIRPGDGLANYQWESFWASVTFRVGGESPRAVAQTESNVPAPAAEPAAPPPAPASKTERDMQALVAVHGRPNPWAAAGYRIGRRALRDLQLTAGDRGLIATHYSPYAAPTISMIDGVQAATGASVGKMSLRYKTAKEDAVRTEFVDTQTGKSVAYRLTASALRELAGGDGGDAAAATVRVLEMPEDDLLETVDPKRPQKAGGSEPAPQGTPATRKAAMAGDSVP